MPALRDLIGQRFNRLFILKQVPQRLGRYKRVLWECLCDCGNKSFATSNHLTSGHTQSCGCLQKQITIKRSTRHGFAKRNQQTREYRAWCDMKIRCQRDKNYTRRSIKVCSKWNNSFLQFYRDLGKCPPGFSLERVNNDRGYFPGNVKWATDAEQRSNKRTNHYLEYQGQRFTLNQWAERTHIKRETIMARIKKLNWSIHDALTIPVRHRNQSLRESTK